MSHAGNSPGQQLLENAAAVKANQNAVKLEAAVSGSANLQPDDGNTLPVQTNTTDLALDSASPLSRANSVQSNDSNISGESGDKTHRALSALLNSVKQSTTTSNDPSSVTQPPVEPIDTAVESEKLISSFKQENSPPNADGPKTADDLRLSNSKEKDDEKANIKAFVERNQDLVTQLTTNLSITRKSSGTGNAPNTPRAKSIPITPEIVVKARETLTASLKQIDAANSFKLAEIDMTTEKLKETISTKIDPNNLDSLPEMLKTPDLLTSFRKILRTAM